MGHRRYPRRAPARTAPSRRLAAGGRSAHVRRLRRADLGDGGLGFRPDAHGADGVVHRVLAFCPQKDGIWALSLQRALETGSYLTERGCCNGCGRCWCAGRDRLAGPVEVDETFISGEEPGLAGGRATGRKPLTGIAVEVGAPKPVPDGAADRCIRRLAARLRNRSRRARCAGHHPRLAGLTLAGGARLRPRPAQPAGRPCPRSGSRLAAARSAPGRLAGQAVAAGHPSGLGGRGPPGQLPG